MADSAAAVADGDRPAGPASPTLRRPARRSGKGRNRRATPLTESFKQYVEEAPPDEVRDLSEQLQMALGRIANGPTSGVSVSCTGRVEGAGVNMGLNSASAPCLRRNNLGGSASGRNSGRDSGAEGSNQNATWGVGSPQGSQAGSTVGSLHNSFTLPRRTSGTDYYEPKSSSRRNSAAGEAMTISMKLNAQKVLAELGEISDGDSDDELVPRLGALELEGVGRGVLEVGSLPNLREESVRGIMREDSKYSPPE